MSDERPGGVSIRGRIENNQGNAAIGSNIQQSQTRIDMARAPTPEEMEQLVAAFANLRAQVEAETPPQLQGEALEKVDEMERAATGPEPDVSAMDRARRWFLQHAPSLFGAVTTVLVNPIVGKIVHSAGNAIAAEYQRRFPEASAETSSERSS
jgi:hypothetical protein